MTNGERLETYAIEGAPNSKVFCLNGAAARKGSAGDIVTIITFASMTREEALCHKPTVIILNEKNDIIGRKKF